MLIDLKLNVNDVRGQGYYNGLNMKGMTCFVMINMFNFDALIIFLLNFVRKHQDVQKRLLNVNPRVFILHADVKT